VPAFPKKQWPVTLRQVMAHTAGIPSDGGDEGPLFGQHCDRPVDALPFFADRDLRFEPGTQYSYSRFGYILVSAAIEKAGDDPFVIFMQKHIFDPLGMNDTLPDSMTEPIPDQSISYFPRFAGDPKYGPDVMRDLDLSCYSGSSIFLSTASDMVRFTLAIDNGKLLQPATVRQLQMSQELRSGEKTGYGLGWDLDEVKTSGGEPINVIGHDGDLLGGVAGSIVTVPSHGNVVVAVFSNTSYADTALLAANIAEAFGHPKK
jgi:serine beta-lactamase-like protein LACTB, mitochondrial